MVEYKLKYEGEKIDELLEAVDSGSVVDANTVSVIEEGNGKPVSSNTIHQALTNKVDKIPGKVLSTNDYTIADMERVQSSVTSIRVNGTKISRKDGAGLLDIGDVSNLYVADFTIDDLRRLSYDEAIESLEVNGKALLQALETHKVIGVLVDNDTPSMLLACAYKVYTYIYLNVSYGSQVYMASIALSDNYDEVEESKSGLISKGNIYDYPLDSYHQYHLEFDSNSVYEAYWNNQEITCDYNALYSAVDTDNDIRIFAGVSGSVPVNAYFIDDDTICLSYIVEDILWKLLVYRSEDDNGNVYGHVIRDEIAHINLHEIKRGSRYIIWDFTLDDILSADTITVTSGLRDAIVNGRPLAIHEKIGGRLLNIDSVSGSFYPTTEIEFIINYNGELRVGLSSRSIIEEGGFVSVIPSFMRSNIKVSAIRNANGDTLTPVDGGGVDVSAGFFSDKSMGYSSDNNQITLIPIHNQITILNKTLMGDGRFSFSPPRTNVAVEYTIKFGVGTQCSWAIYDNSSKPLQGNFYGKTLSNIPAGFYLMKITLYTYTDTKGNPQTEYIAEVMQTTK